MSCNTDPKKKFETADCPACDSQPLITLSAVLKLIGVVTVVLFILDRLPR
jgi:hypothetical protein